MQTFDDYKKDIFSALKLIDKIELKKITFKIKKTIEKNNIIYVCGNGGSAAIANHYIADFNKLIKKKKFKPKFMSLVSNMPIITAIANDYDYSKIFSEQLDNFCKKNDIVIAISGSGNSKNIKRVVKYCKEKKIFLISFTGFDGGQLKKKSNLNLHIKSKNYGTIEDCHQILMHYICQSL